VRPDRKLRPIRWSEEMVMSRLRRKIRTVLVLAGVVLLSFLGGVLIGCGDDDDSGSAQPAEAVTQPENGEETERDGGDDDGGHDRDDGKDDRDDRDAD
jgi:hypothetical protein